MSSTPPGGYQPGEYVPFKDRDPANPTAVAGQPGWGEQVAAQQPVAGPHDPYRAIYGYDAPARIELSGWSRRVLAYVFDSFLAFVVGAPFFLGYWQMFQEPGDDDGHVRQHHAEAGRRGADVGGDADGDRRPPVLRVLRLQLVHPAGPDGLHLRQDRRRHQARQRAHEGADRCRPVVRPPAGAHRGRAPLQPRLPLADLGRQEADVRGQDHEHARDRPGAGPAGGPGRQLPPD